MHHTRRTHNAHNETQRRLRNLSKKRGYKRNYPHYNIVYFKDNGDVDYIDSCKDYGGSCVVKVKGHHKGGYITSSEELDKLERHSFYLKYSKSNYKYWKWAKRRLHKIWRTKPIEELTFTYKDAICCSLFDLW